MAEESFEDEKTAGILNRDFVSIKVDREERPDIDAVYMSVCQAMTGSGGWPMTIFMTPDQKPFFAGTYFPRESAMGMVGFPELLEAVARAWRQKRRELVETADGVLSQLRSELPFAVCGASQNSWSGGVSRGGAEAMVSQGLRELKRAYDSEHGGFGTAPKFPSGHQLLFLMDRFSRAGDREALQMAEKTLQQMYKGGLYDHLGGGFSRYSTDNYFLAPHFEKMLYDNALLLQCYGRAWQLTKNPLYRHVAEGTAAWMLREMAAAGGGFYSSQDADSQGEEGKFYTFTYEELLTLLGPEEGGRFAAHYGVTSGGNFEGKNILNLLAHENPKELEADLLEKVYRYRKGRFPLHTDDKILTAWNGMAVWALAGLSRQLGEKKYLKAAERCMHFLLEKAAAGRGDAGPKGPAGDNLFVSCRLGTASGAGLLDDYAWVTAGLLALYEATSKKDYLEKAARFGRAAIRRFFDSENGGFYLWGRENERLILNQKEVYDGASPSGNGVMAWNLVRLAHYTGSAAASPARQGAASFVEAAEKQIAYMAEACENYPAGHCFFLTALADWLDSASFYVCRDGVCGPLAGADSRKSGSKNGEVRS